MKIAFVINKINVLAAKLILIMHILMENVFHAYQTAKHVIKIQLNVKLAQLDLF